MSTSFKTTVEKCARLAHALMSTIVKYSMLFIVQLSILLSPHSHVCISSACWVMGHILFAPLEKSHKKSSAN